MVNLPDLETIRAEKGRRSLKEYIKFMWSVIEPTTPFVDNWHIDCFTDHLTHLSEIRNLLVNVPPGTSKSLIFTVFYPSWKWLHEPSSRWLFASYNRELSEKFSNLNRRLYESTKFQRHFGNLFSLTKSTEDTIENHKTGYRKALSVGSTATGEKGNYCIVDDPHNADEADSERAKQRCINWYTDAFHSRLCDFHKDCRCIVGQRIAKDDLSGFIIENYKQDWTHLCLPWDARPQMARTTPLGWTDPRKNEGEPLWAERFPESEVDFFRKKPKTFSAQWNQDPITGGASFFNVDDIRYWEDDGDVMWLGGQSVQKRQCTRIITADLATSAKAGADYTAIAVVDLTRTGEIAVQHLFRERTRGVKIVPILRALYETWRPSFIVIEDAGNHGLVVDQARTEGLPVRVYRPNQHGDKETRAIPLQVRMEAGQFYLAKDKGWTKLLVSEFLHFPQGDHDDIVDCVAIAAIEANKRCRRIGPDLEKKQEISDDRWFTMAVNMD